MSKTDFKTLPTADTLAAGLRTLAARLELLRTRTGSALKQQRYELLVDLQESAKVTDAAISELTLQVAFLMSVIRVKRPLHSGLADVSGVVQFEQVTAADLYRNGGREEMVKARDNAMAAFRKAQGDGEGVPAVGANSTVEEVTAALETAARSPHKVSLDDVANADPAVIRDAVDIVNDRDAAAFDKELKDFESDADALADNAGFDPQLPPGKFRTH